MLPHTIAVRGALLVLAGMFLVGAGGCQKTKTAASVNGERITQEELYREIDKRSGRQVLEELILRKLVAQAAQKQKTAIDDKDVTQKVDELKKLVEATPGKKFEDLLKERNTTLDEVKGEIRINLLLRKLAAATITAQDKKAYYDKNKEQLAQVEASHILVKSEKEAQAIQKELKEGKEFAALAARHSVDPGTKGKGGYLGFFHRRDMTPPFAKAAFETKAGELSGIVKTDYGFHVLKVISKKSTYDELASAIEDEMLGQNNNERVRTFINSLKDGAKVVYEPPYTKLP